MDFSLTEERQMLADTIDRYVRNDYPLAGRTAAAHGTDGFDPAQYTAMADLGLISALFTEDQGGFGGTGFDISVVFEGLGRGLVVEPFNDTALMPGSIFASLGDDRLEGIVDGSDRYAVAVFEDTSGYDPAFLDTVAATNGEGFTLTGRKTVVKFAEGTKGIIVTAKTGKGTSLFLVETADAPLMNFNTVDGGTASEVHLNDTPAQLLGVEGDGLPVLQSAINRSILALSAEALGIMEVIKDMTLEYLRTRKQFGVPIGKFQALQHRMAQLLLEVGEARSAVTNLAADLDGSDAQITVHATKHSIGRIGQFVAEESIQMHGGIGMTWEYDLGHYAKRLVMIDHELGDQDFHLQQFINATRPAL